MKPVLLLRANSQSSLYILCTCLNYARVTFAECSVVIVSMCHSVRLINHSVRVSAKMHSRAGTSAVAICVCVPHVPPVQ